jgi:hypothetical protein
MVHAMLFVAALIAEDKDCAPNAPTFKVKFHEAEDSFVIQKEIDRTVFVITSKTGIGGADFELAKGAWPEKVSFRLRNSEGKGLRDLEDLRLYTDRVLIEGDLKMLGKMPFCFMGADGKADAIQPGGSVAAGRIDVRVERKEAGMDVILPVNLLTGSGKLRVSWIDNFRR